MAARFWNELSITPVLNESDQLTYYIGIQKDVTEQVEAKQRVRELEAEVADLKAELAPSEMLTNGQKLSCSSTVHQGLTPCSLMPCKATRC